MRLRAVARALAREGYAAARPRADGPIGGAGPTEGGPAGALGEALAWLLDQSWCDGKIGAQVDDAQLRSLATGATLHPDPAGLLVQMVSAPRERAGPSAPPLPLARMGVPVLLVTGWQHPRCRLALDAYAGLTADGPCGDSMARHRLLIGPWSRPPVRTLSQIHVWWWQKCLEQVEPALDEADLPVRYFDLAAGEWRACCKWPPGGDVASEAGT